MKKILEKIEEIVYNIEDILEIIEKIGMLLCYTFYIIMANLFLIMSITYIKNIVSDILLTFLLIFIDIISIITVKFMAEDF